MDQSPSPSSSGHILMNGMPSAMHPLYPPELAPGSPALHDAVNKLKFFLATAPSTYDQSSYDQQDPNVRDERLLNRFQLPTGEMITCVYWNGLYHITGTDIVRALNFRFLAFGRPVKNVKKFEEGIFSDLRNLKSGTDATLEDPKSPFLELLFKYNCIRTQKKQKVFYWFSVPHDRLFLDALDRDLKREKLGVESTTEAVAEPALSFVYNPTKTLYEQFAQSATGVDGDSLQTIQQQNEAQLAGLNGHPGAEPSMGSGRDSDDGSPSHGTPSLSRSGSIKPGNALFGTFSLFEGSPSYKQRRKPTSKRTGNAKQHPKLLRSDQIEMSMSPHPADHDERMRSVSASVADYAPHNGGFSRSASASHVPHYAQQISHQQPVSYSFGSFQADISGSGHVSSPEQQKLYACSMPQCNRVFKRIDVLRHHEKSHFAERRPQQFVGDGGQSGMAFAAGVPIQHVPMAGDSQPHYTTQLISPPMSVVPSFQQRFDETAAMTSEPASETYGSWQEPSMSFMRNPSIVTTGESDVEPAYDPQLVSPPGSVQDLAALGPMHHHSDPNLHDRRASFQDGVVSRMMPQRTQTMFGSVPQAQAVMATERRHRSATPTLLHRGAGQLRKGSLDYPLQSSLGHINSVRAQGPTPTSFGAQLQMINALNAEVATSTFASPSLEAASYPNFAPQTPQVDGLGFSGVDFGPSDTFLHPRSLGQQARPATASEIPPASFHLAHFSPFSSGDGVAL